MPSATFAASHGTLAARVWLCCGAVCTLTCGSCHPSSVNSSRIAGYNHSMSKSCSRLAPSQHCSIVPVVVTLQERVVDLGDALLTFLMVLSALSLYTVFALGMASE
eukprot:6345915-Amphidinium_carterae.2